MNKEEIIRAIDYSACAYRDIQPYCEYNLIRMISEADFDVQYCLRSKGGELSITFRGTDSLINWITDFAFWEKAIPYGNIESKIKVHTGFLCAYKTPLVRDYILNLITDGIHHIKITGHSMGAALAVLCAADIQYNFPEKNIEVVLFGCPRVGNGAFARSYNKRVNKTLRVENGNDIVTKVPFSFMGFRHVGARLHVGFPRMFGAFSFKNHYPHQYYSSLLNRFMP